MPYKYRTMESQKASLASDLTKETHCTTIFGHAMSELLEDAGNCRHINHQVLINLRLLSDSLAVSEQQKLRAVLDWAESFLSSRPDVDNEVCRYHTQRREAEKTPPAICSPPVSCLAGRNELHDERATTEKLWQEQLSDHENSEQNNYLSRLKPPPQEDLHRDDVTWPENKEIEVVRSIARLNPASKQIPGHHSCRTSQVHTSNHRHDTNLSDSRSNHTFASDAASCWSNAGRNSTDTLSAMKMLLQNCDSTDIFNRREISGNQKELRKESEVSQPGKERIPRDGRMKESSSLSHSEPEITNTANARSTYCLKIPSNLSVYEQYQLCAGQLHHLKLTKSAEKEKKAPARAQALPASPSTSTMLPSAEATEERASGIAHRTTHEREAALTKCGEINLDSPMDKTRAAVSTESRSTSTQADLNGNDGGFTKRSAQADVKGQNKRTEVQYQWGLCENSTRTNGGNGGISPRQQTRPQSAVANKYTMRPNTQTLTKGPTLGARVKHTDAHPQPAKTHTLPCYDSRPASASTAHNNHNDCKYSPAGVRAYDWLFLPDEVWLHVLSVLPLCDLCTVLRVCSRLHTLATDHTLWKSVRMENCTLTDQWLLSVGTRRPRSVCLYSCSSLSVTSCGLQMFFTLCRNTLEEVCVTSCVGPGLHGDQMLPLVGQLCDHVTSVDVSWSRATDSGVRALSDGVAGLRLKSVLLNGCHITDDSLKRLVTRHKQSLCRLEVFGCQFLTASCLRTVFETCPGLQHLNIGQVPKVNALSLAAMTSRLKSLISLNLTGLKAVTDAILESLLQNCIALEILTLSSCPGVTDLTLHNISKYAPCVRSLDVSGCKAVTDSGVHSLTLGCKRLQQLDLGSTGTGSRGVALLANHCGGHLRSVKLSFCRVGAEDILELCRRCVRLEVLHLYGCAQLPTERALRDANATVQVFPLP